MGWRSAWEDEYALGFERGRQIFIENRSPVRFPIIMAVNQHQYFHKEGTSASEIVLKVKAVDVTPQKLEFLGELSDI